jgi:hypothetical protein
MVANVFLREYRDSILSIAASHGMSHVRVFGSMAQNAYTADSDIDLLVKIDPSRSLLDIIDAKYQMEDLTRRRVDIITEGALSPYLQDEILQSAVEL